MAEEQTQEVTPVENNAEVEVLKENIKGLERKNHELIGKIQRAKLVPDDVDVQELIDFKRNAEQADLEAKGQYTEARKQLEQQFRDATKEKDGRIAELEARVKELELTAPAMSALAPLVHDTEYAMNKLGKDNFQVEADGSIVYVEGYDRISVKDAVEKKLAAAENSRWVVKQPRPQGGGATPGRSSSSGSVSESDLKYFMPGTENLTEQTRIYKQQGAEVWRKYRDMAESR